MQAQRILIIDDDVEVANALSSLLATAGHRSMTAYSGPAGLSIAESYRPDIVFLDLAMPGMNGYEVAPAIRKMAGMENVLIIALTGSGDKNTRSEALRAGCDAHLTKPPQLRAIVGLIEAASSTLGQAHHSTPDDTPNAT